MSKATILMEIIIADTIQKIRVVFLLSITNLTIYQFNNIIIRYSMTLHQANGQKIGFAKKIIILALLALIGFIGFAVAQKSWSKYKLEKEIRRLQAQITDLEKNNSDTEGLIGYLATDDYLEREARAKLNLKKPGEKVAIFAPRGAEKASGEETGGASSQAMTEKKGASGRFANVWRWWEYFFEN